MKNIFILPQLAIFILLFYFVNCSNSCWPSYSEAEVNLRKDNTFFFSDSNKIVYLSATEDT